MAEEQNTRPTCHFPVPPTRPTQKRVTHVSKIGCTMLRQYKCPVRNLVIDIVSDRPEKQESDARACLYEADTIL